jgi:hypothetical protein
MNDRAAEKELSELRTDTVRGLRYEHSKGGTHAVIRLLVEAGCLPASAETLRKVA